jgi:hypothetical protein
MHVAVANVRDKSVLSPSSLIKLLMGQLIHFSWAITPV